jgi:hypothetical protein
MLVVSALLLPSTSSAQTINACVGKNGSVRIVTDGSPCRYPDTPLMWNAGLRVYDADGVEIGPLSGIGNVTFFVDGKGYAAPVGPNGWVATQGTFYFLNDQCSGRPYVLRSVSSDPAAPPPPPLPAYFFTSLQVADDLGFYQDGNYLKKVLTMGIIEVWRWDLATASCLAFDAQGTYWFGSHAAITLPSHPAPFTIR